MTFADESDKGSSRSAIVWSKSVLFVCELKIVAITGYALLESTDFMFRKARYGNEDNLHALERIKRSSVEVRDLKLNIANNSRRNRDELINGVFDRQTVRSNTNHQRNMERIRSN